MVWLLLHIYSDTLSTLCFVYIYVNQSKTFIASCIKSKLCNIWCCNLTIKPWNQSHDKYLYISQSRHTLGNNKPVSIYKLHSLTCYLKSRENYQKNCHKTTNLYYCHNLIKQKSSLECWPLCCKVSHESSQPSMNTASKHICTILHLGRKLSEKRP